MKIPGRLLASEFRSFLGRIRALLNTKLYRRDLPVDPGVQITSSLPERQRFQDACIRDAYDLLAERPWLTLADREIFVRAWQRGAEWTARNYCRKSLSFSRPSSPDFPESSERQSDNDSAAPGPEGADSRYFGA